MKTFTAGMISLCIAMLSFTSCRDKENRKSNHLISKTDTVFIHDNTVPRNEYIVSATLYQQTAGEYRALCYQAFNLAAFMLDKDLSDKHIDKHRVVIVDIDETVLDNSPFQGKSILSNTAYPKFWNEWCSSARALAVPGAVSFLNYAKANGVGVYYVTNRDESLRAPTLRNLISAGFPFADDAHLIMKTAESSKEGRRQAIAARNHISLLFGDNLADFSYVFDKQNPERRKALVDSLRTTFGSKFIVLPNAMYGDWEAALYDYDWSQADSIRAKIRLKNINGFQ